MHSSELIIIFIDLQVGVGWVWFITGSRHVGIQLELQYNAGIARILFGFFSSSSYHQNQSFSIQLFAHPTLGSQLRDF